MSDSELVDRIEVRLFVYLRDVGEKRDSGRKLNWKRIRKEPRPRERTGLSPWVIRGGDAFRG
jgi:hypothetical protein